MGGTQSPGTGCPDIMDDQRKHTAHDREIEVDAEDREFSPLHEIIEENLEITPAEQNSHRRAFKAGYLRAEQTPDFHAGGESTSRARLTLVTARKWIGYSAAAVLLVAAIAGSWWWSARREAPPQLLQETGQVYAVSGMFGDLRSNIPGFNRFRTSKLGIAVPGVSVEHRAPGVTPTASLFGETAWAQQPPAVPTSGELVFKLNGTETQVLDLGQVQPDGRFVPVELDQAGQLITTDTTIRYPIDIAPGDAIKLNDTMLVSLDSEAPGPWQGELVHDLNWPDAFRFGNVVDGIFQFKGPFTTHLRFTKALSAGYLSHLTDNPERVKVIAESGTPIETLPDCDTHWYNLMEGSNKVTAQFIKGGFTLEWSVAAEQRYALLSPPAKDGELVVTYVYHNGLADGTGHRHVISSKYIRHQLGRWYSRYIAPLLEPTRLTALPQSPILSVDLDAPNNLHGREAITVLGNERELDPAEFTAIRHDFTYSDPVEYGPMQLSCPVHEGRYELQTNPVTGEVRLTGDLELIDGLIEWDLDADHVMDSTGTSYTVDTHPLQVREIAVLFREINGSRLRIKTSLALPVPGTFWHKDNCPAMFAVPDPPTEKVHVLSMIEGSMQPPYPAGVLACGRLIPYIIVEPSTEFLNRPLDILTFTVNGSAGWGSVGDIYFDPYVFPARLTGEIDDAEFTALTDLFGDMDKQEFSYPNASIEADTFINMIQAGHGQKVMDHLAWLMEKGEPDDYRRSTYEQAFSFDLAELPSEDVVLRKLIEFKKDKFFTLEYLTEFEQQMQFTINLQHKILKPGQVIIVGLTTQTSGAAVMGQWDVFSGGADPARVEIKAVGSDDKDVHYFDFSPFKP